MLAKAALLTIILASLAVACARSPDPEQIEQLAAAAPGLLERAEGEIATAQWPAAITQLGPKRVYATPEGLYVVLSTAFVEERGLFVPRLQDFAPPTGGDPSYTSLGQGVFSYHVKG